MNSRKVNDPVEGLPTNRLLLPDFFSDQENRIRFNRRRFWLYSQGYFLTSYLMYNSGQFLLCNGAS